MDEDDQRHFAAQFMDDMNDAKLVTISLHVLSVICYQWRFGYIKGADK